MRSKLPALVLALSMTSLALVPVAAAREETKAYTTGADVLAACQDGDLVGALAGGNYGSACFDVEDGETEVSLQIQDVYLQDIGGAISFHDADGDSVGDLEPFCGGSSGPVPLPSGTASIEVFVNGPVFQLVDCQTTATSTFGDVTATFS